MNIFGVIKGTIKGAVMLQHHYLEYQIEDCNYFSFECIKMSFAGHPYAILIVLCSFFV